MSHEQGRVTPKFMNEMAAAIDHTVNERLGEGIGFIFIAVGESNNDMTDFQYVSNITEEDAIKAIMTEVVTHNETKQ